MDGDNRYCEILLTMEFSYDPRYNIGYICFKDKAGQEVNNVKISEGVTIDIAPDGSLYGIELLNANDQLQGDNKQQIFSLINEATGEKKDIPLEGDK